MEPEGYCKTIEQKLQQRPLLEELNLFVCEHVEVDAFSSTKLAQDRGLFSAIRIRTDESVILLEGRMRITREGR